MSCVGFLDGVYLFAGSVPGAPCVLRDLCIAFARVGLVLNPFKVKRTMNKHSTRTSVTDCPHFVVSGVQVHPTKNFVCLGSVMSDDLFETQTIEHRIGRATPCFHKWASVLLSGAPPLESRLEFWSRVISPSLLWGLETARDKHHTHSHKKLRTCQR